LESSFLLRGAHGRKNVIQSPGLREKGRSNQADKQKQFFHFLYPDIDSVARRDSGQDTKIGSEICCHKVA
jgi:hypothetical protein